MAMTHFWIASPIENSPRGQATYRPDHYTPRKKACGVMVMTQLDTWNEDSRRASFIDIPGQPQVFRVTSAGHRPGPTRPR